MSWQLWRRQATVVARAELRRSLVSKHALSVALLAAMPLALALLRAVFMPSSVRANPALSTAEFAQIFHTFLLRFVVFFSTALIFVRLFRGEILERSLHYSLLAPMRREVLVAGKYVGGLLASLAILLPATAAAFVAIYLPHLGSGAAAVFNAAVLGQLGGYLAVVALACAAYGALFLLAGLYVRNPMVPAILFLAWEILTPFLPPLLKALSLVHYLTSLAPVAPRLGPLALLSQPVGPWHAAGGLLAACAVLLVLAARRAARLEVSYAAD